MTTRDPGPNRKTSGQRLPEVTVCDPGGSIVPAWAVRGQAAGDRRISPDPAERSADHAADVPSDEAAVARCYTKQTLADYLRVSIRSLDRAAALGMLPCPDLIVGRRSPRWSPATIERWLRNRPRLLGRKGNQS